jgi:far upstream element-binding protein
MTVFQDTNEVSNSEKQLRIIGEVDKVDFARQLVTDLLTEKEIETIRNKAGPKTMTNDYGTMRGGNTVEVPVSPQYIGLVIGKGGENIRRIQQESNAKVQFDTTKSDLNGNKLCIVSGTPDAVNRAVDMVKEIIDMGMVMLIH